MTSENCLVFAKNIEEENERLRAENETLRRDLKTAIMGDSAELRDVKRENEKLRKALRPFASYSDWLSEEEKETGNRVKDTDNYSVSIQYLRAAADAIRESGE